MAENLIQFHTDKLLIKVMHAWGRKEWSLVDDLTAEILDLDPDNKDAKSYAAAARRRQMRRAVDTARALDLIPVLAFLTDGLNRIQWVNRRFAIDVGDPVQDGFGDAMRFVPAVIAGPYRDRFPRWQREISACLSGLYREVDAGNLQPGTLRLIEHTLDFEPALQRAQSTAGEAWDGTMVVRDTSGRMSMVEERVLPVLDAEGVPTGFHLTQWFPVGQPPSEATLKDGLACLTPRQVAIGRLFATGLTAREVAEAANISWRTARDHLEEIYGRLDVHSRAELSLAFARAGLLWLGNANDP